MAATTLWTVSLALMQVKEAVERIEIELKNGRAAHVGETLTHAKEAVSQAEEWVARAESSGQAAARKESS